MDPSIMKLLEDDEDEAMHSGADVEALTAALNRDIERDSTDVSAPLDSSSAGIVTQGTSSLPSQLPGQWQAPSEEMNSIQQSHQKDEYSELQHNEHVSSQMEHSTQQSSMQSIHVNANLPGPNQITSNQEIFYTEHQQQTLDHKEKQETVEPNGGTPVNVNHVKFTEQPPVQPHDENKVQNQQQYAPQQLSSRQAQPLDQTNNPMRRMRLSSIPFHSLIPVLRPHLDKDRSMQLNTVFSKLKSNDISRDDFLRVIRNIVGDQMLRQAAQKVMQQQAQALAARSSQTGQVQHQFQAQASSQQIPSRNIPQFPEHHAFSQVDIPGLHGSQPSSSNTVAVKHERDSIPLQASNKPQSHSQIPPPTFSVHGNTGGSFNLHSFPRAGSNPHTILKPQTGDSQIRPIPLSQGTIANQPGTSQPINLTNISKYETQNIMGENKRLPGASLSTYSNIPTLQQKQIPWQQTANKEQISMNSSTSHVKQEVVEQTKESQQMQSSSTTPSVQVGSNQKTPQRKPIVGQKKPLEMQVTPLPSSKKQKHVAFQDQSIEQLNDVTAVSGVNLREEEEQLLAAPKEESRASEATRRAVQEEEERLILQKIPLQKKLAEIISKCGIENTSSDVERCLSMCVEERMRGLIAQLIRFSKQRVDIEKSRHQIVLTSDVRQQVLAINRHAKDEWDKKQAEEAEKLRKLNDIEGNVTTDMDKDETRSKAPKVNKEEDDKMRTTAANVAARAAVGGDDMLSKWQLMAELARQKREGGTDATSSSHPTKASANKSTQNVGRLATESQEGDRKGGSNAAIPGPMRRFGRSQPVAPHPKVVRSISTKDVIAVLEREPQMVKSPFIYRLYEKMSWEPVAD